MSERLMVAGSAHTAHHAGVPHLSNPPQLCFGTFLPANNHNIRFGASLNPKGHGFIPWQPTMHLKRPPLAFESFTAMATTLSRNKIVQDNDQHQTATSRLPTTHNVIGNNGGIESTPCKRFDRSKKEVEMVVMSPGLEPQRPLCASNKLNGSRLTWGKPKTHQNGQAGLHVVHGKPVLPSLQTKVHGHTPQIAFNGLGYEIPHRKTIVDPKNLGERKFSSPYIPVSQLPDIPPILYTPKFKLKSGTHPRVAISSHEFLQAAQYHTLTLVATFDKGRPSVNMFEYFVNTKWGLRNSAVVGLLDSKSLSIHLQSREDFQSAWSRDGRSFDKYRYILSRWENTYSTTKENNMVAIWLTLPYLPLPCQNPSILVAIGNALGKYLCSDKRTKKLKHPIAPRICVEMDSSQPLPEKILIEIENGEKMEGTLWQEIVYESKDGHCTFCNKEDHGLTSCRQWAIARRKENKANMSMIHKNSKYVDQPKKKRGNNGKETIFEEPVQIVSSINTAIDTGNEALADNTKTIEVGKLPSKRVVTKSKKPTIMRYVRKEPISKDTMEQGRNISELHGTNHSTMVVYQPTKVSNSFTILDRIVEDKSDIISVEELQESIIRCPSTTQQLIQYTVESPRTLDRELMVVTENRIKPDKRLTLPIRGFVVILDEHGQNARLIRGGEQDPKQFGVEVGKHKLKEDMIQGDRNIAVQNLASMFRKSFATPFTPVEQIVGARNKHNPGSSTSIKINSAAGYVHTLPKCVPPVPFNYEDINMEH